MVGPGVGAIAATAAHSAARAFHFASQMLAHVHDAHSAKVRSRRCVKGAVLH
jgi:hypothetical protein